MSTDLYSKYAEVLGKNLASSCVNISLLDSYVWFKNPKVASSTVDVTMQSIAMRNIPNKNIVVGPHATVEKSVHVKPYQLHATILEDILVSDGMFRFTFVRNPYSRLVSAYNDKINGDKPNKMQILKHLDKDPADIKAKLSFDEFVQAVDRIAKTKNGINKLDRHWIPQVCTTGASWISHDFVGKLESFDKDIRFVFDKLKLNIDDHYKYYAPHRSKKKVDFKDYLKDPTTLSLINELYAEDFDQFGYEYIESDNAVANLKAA